MDVLLDDFSQFRLSLKKIKKKKLFASKISYLQELRKITLLRLKFQLLVPLQICNLLEDM